jgi:GrpB-like predicted nucleotidyltransferase (UPF0157 family)
MARHQDELVAGGVVVGLERLVADPIEIVAPDPAWLDRYTEMAARLEGVLGETALRIDHVGSTAVPGLMAKPTIDVQVTVADADDEDGFRSAIEGLGLELRFVIDGWRYFRPPGDLPRDWQVHVRTAGSPRQRAALLFRDYLRAHPAQAREYEVLKVGLAEVHETDRIAYNDGKSEWIEAALRRAEAWATACRWEP